MHNAYTPFADIVFEKCYMTSQNHRYIKRSGIAYWHKKLILYIMPDKLYIFHTTQNLTSSGKLVLSATPLAQRLQF